MFQVHLAVNETELFQRSQTSDKLQHRLVKTRRQKPARKCAKSRSIPAQHPVGVIQSSFEWRLDRASRRRCGTSRALVRINFFNKFT
jgi:hypothetical protein